MTFTEVIWTNHLQLDHHRENQEHDESAIVQPFLHTIHWSYVGDRKERGEVRLTAHYLDFTVNRK